MEIEGRIYFQKVYFLSAEFKYYDWLKYWIWYIGNKSSLFVSKSISGKMLTSQEVEA